MTDDRVPPEPPDYVPPTPIGFIDGSKVFDRQLTEEERREVLAEMIKPTPKLLPPASSRDRFAIGAGVFTVPLCLGLALHLALTWDVGTIIFCLALIGVSLWIRRQWKKGRL